MTAPHITMILRFSAFLLIATHLHAEEVKPPRDASWKLVWSDEFNTDGPPDPQVWDFESGFERNRELQWYQKENVVCRDGSLVFEARRERRAVGPEHHQLVQVQVRHAEPLEREDERLQPLEVLGPAGGELVDIGPRHAVGQLPAAAMAPPRNSPFADTASTTVAVPNATTTHGPP